MTMPPPRGQVNALTELKRSWLVLLGCSLGASVGAGAFPLFLMPVIGLRLEERFDWSRLDTSSLTSVAFVGGALGSILVGWLNDKWSTKIPVIVSLVAMGGMLGLAALAPREVLAWQIGAFAFMLLGSGSLSAPFVKIVCEHFQAMRGLALGITIGSVSFAGAVALPAITRLLDAQGTERFFMVAGLVYLATLAPLLFLLLPRSQAKREAIIASPQRDATARPLALWLLGVAGTLLSVTTGSAAHLAAVAADGKNVAPATIGSIFAIGVMISRPVAGFVIDYVNAARVGALVAALAALGLVIAALYGDQYIIVSALLLAISVGAEFDIVAYLASRYMAPTLFGRVFSLMYAGMLLAAAAGPVFIAVQLQAFGGYRIPFLSAAGLAGIAAVMLIVLPPYRRDRSET